MLTKYQQGSLHLFGCWGKLKCPKKNHHKLVRSNVDMTKHNGRDIGLPDAIGVPNRQAAQRRWVQRILYHCQSVSDVDGLPARLFQRGQEYPSPTFSETPGTPNRELTNITACRESSHSISAYFNQKPLSYYPYHSLLTA